MHPHAQLIEGFYTAFQKRDAESMVACYHPEVQFSDPVFQDLRGPRAGAMWRMLCERAQDFSLEFRDVTADDRAGAAHWEAHYTFSGTGRKVHNILDAKFEFQGGKIVRHTDSFDLWRWAGMALGAKGKLLGWLPPVQGSIRAKAMAGLVAFERKAAGA